MTNDISQNPQQKRERRDRREEILQAASNLFAQNGFRGTSLASIAAAVDLTEPGLLHYFPNKVNLLQNVLEFRDQEDEKKYTTLIQPDRLTLSNIFEALEELVAENENQPGLVQLFTVLVSESIREEHPSHRYFVQRYDQIRENLNEYFDNAVENEGNPVDINLNQLSSLIFAIMDGLQIQWLLAPDQVRMSQTFKLFSKIMLSYLEKETG